MNQMTKLTITVRVEPGSLGPKGKDYVEDYCKLAQNAFSKKKGDFADWAIIPRYDKTLPEIEFSLLGQTLDEARVSQALQVLDTNIEEVEEHTMEMISQLIDRYLGHKY